MDEKKNNNKASKNHFRKKKEKRRIDCVERGLGDKFFGVKTLKFAFVQVSEEVLRNETLV